MIWGQVPKITRTITYCIYWILAPALDHDPGSARMMKKENYRSFTNSSTLISVFLYQRVEEERMG
jgi:hypothetical protein